MQISADHNTMDDGNDNGRNKPNQGFYQSLK